MLRHSISATRDVEQVNSMGVISTVAGVANPYALAGDGGAATGASLYNPQSVAIATNGDLFIADTINHAIRKV